MMLTAWLAARRRNREMANAAATLVEENERLRKELAAAQRQLERHGQILAELLVDAVDRCDAIQNGDAS